MRHIPILLLLTNIVYADIEYKVENSNFTLSQASLVPYEDESYLYNYDRLRVRVDFKDEYLFATAIGDMVNYIGADYIDSASFGYVALLRSDTPFGTQTDLHYYDNSILYAKLYRLYGGYDDATNRIVVGLQNITMGVGHIWTPTNLFNPKNSYALEPDETYGVAALSYTRYIGDKSQLHVVASQRRDKSYKYALEYKLSLKETDIVLSAITSETSKMIGYSIEGDLSDTGIEWRSEGAYIKSQINAIGVSGEMSQNEEKFFQGILGADYGFANGVNLTIEALYSSKVFTYGEIAANIESQLISNMTLSHFYLGATVSYDFTIYLSGALVYIESFGSDKYDKHSRFIAPALTYTLNDHNSFTLGAMIQNGSSDSEFSSVGSSYYLKYVLSF